MNNKQIAKVFEDIADLLELKGENVFKVRAYQKAARAIEQSPVEVEQLVKEERLREVPGVGEAIAKKTIELVQTGKLEYYESLKAEFPPGLSALLDIPGIGPKTAMLFSKDLGVTSVDELEKALVEGKVAQLPRMGEKTAENILRHIQAFRRKTQRIPIGQALPIVDEIFAGLREVPGVRNLMPAGSLRRFQETVGDIDLMGTADDPTQVIDAFTALPMVNDVLGKGGTKASVVVSGGLQVDLRIVDHDSFGSLLQYFTGSKQHNIDLRQRALRKGLSLSEYGITVLQTGQLEKYATEEAFYGRLGLAHIPPEIREGTGEIDLAANGRVPTLIEAGDLKGDLHVHSDWSDGHASIGTMAQAAREMGYEYVCIADHSYGRGIARGLSRERLEEQIAEIEKLNQTIKGIRILRGMEVDIRSDGSLDMPDELLERLDVVTGSVHSGLGQSQEQMTSRIVAAMENPNMDILGHPTGRLMPDREPSEVDMEAVFQAARRTGTMLEINAMPSRLDLKDTHIHRARELGVMLVINTDAHSPEHLGFNRFGIGIARRGWCEAGDVANTRSLAELLKLIKSKGKRS